jgi:hypothetical protein
VDLEKLIAQVRAALSAKLAERATHTTDLQAKRAAVESGDATVSEDAVKAVIAARSAVDAQIDALTAREAELVAEQERDAAIAKLQTQVAPAARGRSYDDVVRVGSEERTYAPHKERGFRDGKFARGSKPGALFERDVVGAFLGDFEAQERLRRHMSEERVERGEYLQRAVGTGAFAGLTVPQYLTDEFAPAAAARRPFADAIRQHELPTEGMSVNISRITTASSVADQSAENAAAAEQDMDDTLLTIPVRTAAGQQTISRQAIERGSGVEPVVMDDLFRRWATNVDSNLLNASTVGLTNVATSIAYTDASPTAAELYPKLLAGQAGVEAALLDQATGENLVIMHSRRWNWLQSQVGPNFPFIGQPGLPALQGGVNLGTAYGKGIRGVLPNGTPVVVDNNIATAYGAGTNEDEIYVVDSNECHIWEDANAPVFIRAEQPKAANLGVLLVVYSYYAFTHARYSHAQKIGGTGLVTPVFA